MDTQHVGWPLCGDAVYYKTHFETEDVVFKGQPEPKKLLLVTKVRSTTILMAENHAAEIRSSALELPSYS